MTIETRNSIKKISFETKLHGITTIDLRDVGETSARQQGIVSMGSSQNSLQTGKMLLTDATSFYTWITVAMKWHQSVNSLQTGKMLLTDATSLLP